MFGRRGVTWEAGAELEDIRKAADYGGHLLFAGSDEGALKLRRSKAGGSEEPAGSVKVLEYARGDTYEGQVMAGLKHGRGVYVWSNGARYDGDWRDNVPSGMGKYVWPDGESYEGGFLYGRREGSGIYTFQDGASFVGLFHDDKPRGKGVCTLPGGRCFQGDYSLFQAYLRATRALRRREDPWAPLKWGESSDPVRNPPWDGFNAVRPGSRHYEEGFSVFKKKHDAPAMSLRTFAIEWPHPLSSTAALDLETEGRRLVPKRLHAEWPRSAPPPRQGEDETAEVEEEEEVVWKVGDVCECEDMVGASLMAICRPEIGGKLEPKPPGMYFKVRVEAVESVWPGFTEGNFPLIICRVSYVGIAKEKPSEWVQASRLRAAKATRNEAVPVWKGWQVADGCGPLGEYKAEAFAPFDGGLQQGDAVECLFPFSGATNRSKKQRNLADLPPPRFLAVAASCSSESLLNEGDPGQDGLWERVTPSMLAAMPRMLWVSERWGVLAERVIGSLPFLAQVNLELGPDALCDMLDDCRTAVERAGPAAPGWVVTSVSATREFAHANRDKMRITPLAVQAVEWGLPCVLSLEGIVMGQTGLLHKAEVYMNDAAPGATVDLEFLSKVRNIIDHCLRLSMLDRETLLHVREDICVFLSGNEPSQQQQASLRADVRTSRHIGGGKPGPPGPGDGARELKKDSVMVQSMAACFEGAAPKIEAPNVLRMVLETRYDPETNSTVRSRVTNFLAKHPSVDGGGVRVLRVAMGSAPESNNDWDTTELRLGLWLPRGRDARDACLELVGEYYATGTPFSNACRKAYHVKDFGLMEESVFLTLVFGARPGGQGREAESRLSFTDAWRRRVRGGESELERVWERQLLREDVANAMELPRDNVVVLEEGACGMRAVVELLCPYGQAPPDKVFSRATALVHKVLAGESVFEGGKAVPLYEYTLSGSVCRGFVPPPLPGGWKEVGVYGSVMGAEVDFEARAMVDAALPTLRRMLISSRISLSWFAPAVSGISQACPPTIASRRLRHVAACRFPLPHSDGIPLFLGVTADKVTLPRVDAPVVICPGHRTIKVRVWAGPQVVSATVELPLGDFGMSEFCFALQNALEDAQWTAPGKGMWRWEVLADQSGRVRVRLAGENFYRFELEFCSVALGLVAGFRPGGPGAGVVIEGALVVKGGEPVLGGRPAIWTCDTIGTGLWQEGEEARGCVEGGHGWAVERPWRAAGRSGLEMAEGCCVRSGGGVSVVLVRQGGPAHLVLKWEKRMKEGQLPVSSLEAVLGPEGGVGAEIVEAVKRTSREGGKGPAWMKAYEGIYDDYKWQGDSVVRRFWRALKIVQDGEKELEKGREKLRESWRMEMGLPMAAKGLKDPVPGEVEEWFGEMWRVGGEQWRRVEASRKECVQWRKLLMEEHECLVKSGCHHNRVLERCNEIPCISIREAVVHQEAKEWEFDLEARGTILPSLALSSASGLMFNTDTVEKHTVEELRDYILTLTPPWAGPEEKVVGSRVYHSHVLRREWHMGAARTLGVGYVAPFGESRDAVQANLQRMTSGPTSSRPPVVLLTGPHHSGKSSALAHFHQTSVRCTSTRRLDHSLSSAPTFPSGSSTGEEVVLTAFVGGGGGGLREAYEYAATEVALAVRGVEVLQQGEVLGNLLSITESEREEDARVRFCEEVAGALREGWSLLLLVDGLRKEEAKAMAGEVLMLHERIAAQLRRGGAHDLERSGAGACVQCVLTCTENPLEAEVGVGGREVEIAPLGRREREVLARRGLAEGGWVGEEAEEEELVKIVCGKEDSGLPRMVLACAMEAARIAREDLRHRTLDSSGATSRAKTVHQHASSLPQMLIPLLLDSILPSLEKDVGVPTVMWTMLHLSLHPHGIPIHDLRQYVRTTLSSCMLMLADRALSSDDNGTPDRPVMLFGEPDHPTFLVDADTREILWDHRKGLERDLATFLASCRKITGMFWLSDAEMHRILTALGPFVRRGGGAGVPSLTGAGGGDVIALQSEDLRAALVFRYDNPGSVFTMATSVEEETVAAGPLEPSTSRTVAFWDRHVDESRVPVAANPAPVEGAKAAGAKQLVVLGGGGSAVLDYEQSAMRGEDVGAFYSSLDDNCVWHLHHLDQVMCLFPGGSVHVSNARFRPRLVKRETLLNRFSVDRDLLFLYSGKAKQQAGGGTVGEDLARRGHSLSLKGVKEGVHLGEPCLLFAVDDVTGLKTEGVWGYQLGEEVDALSSRRANFRALTGDLAKEFELASNPLITGYSVFLDACTPSDGDAFLLTGGASVAQWSKYEDIRIRATPDITKIAGGAPVYYYNKRKMVLLRRGEDRDGNGGGPWGRPGSVSELPAAMLLKDITNGEAVWDAGSPWFGLRMGPAYVLYVGDAKPGVKTMCEGCNGTLHEAPRAEGGWEAHFHCEDDFERAKWKLGGFPGGWSGVEEVLKGKNVVSVMMKLKAEAKNDEWGSGPGGAGVMFPPKQKVFMWCCSFAPVNVRRDRWHSLAVSIDNVSGVLVCLEGRTVGRSPLPRGSQLYIEPHDALMCVGDPSCCGPFDGYLRNVGMYRRSLTLSELQAMTTRGPPSKIRKSNKEIAAEKAAAGGQAVAAIAPPAKKDDYVKLVQALDPLGFWPLAEKIGLDCVDKSVRGEKEGAEGAVVAKLGSGGGGGVTGLGGGDLVVESKHRASVMMGKQGPTSLTGVGNSLSVFFQGGGIRGLEGGLCKVKDEEVGNSGGIPRRIVTHYSDFSLEVWMQRSSPLFNPCETIMSYNSDMAPVPGGMWWMLDAKGRLDFRMEGESRGIGPCPVAAITDEKWHHVVLTRTGDVEIVNNWSFYLDGELKWTTRHDGVPQATPTSTLLLGRRHGEFWGAGRGWRPGIGDPSCLQGNLACFAFYTDCLEPQSIKAHYEMSPAGFGAEEEKEKPAAQCPKPGGEAESGQKLGPGWEKTKAVVAKAKKSALQHRPMVWGRTVKMTEQDVGAFFGSLKGNRVWEMTRRVVTGGATGVGVDMRIGLGEGGAVRKTVLGVSSSVERSRIEGMHRVAAQAMCDLGDPGGGGAWESASPSVLRGVVRHLCGGRVWGRLEVTIASLFFAGKYAMEFGLLGLVRMLEGVIHAIDQHHADEGTAMGVVGGGGAEDDAAACRSTAELHLEFFQVFLARFPPGQSFPWKTLWDEAATARLPGVEGCVDMVTSAVERVRILVIPTPNLNLPALPGVIPAEITVGRLGRLLKGTLSLGLEVLCAGGGKEVRDAVDAIPAWEEGRGAGARNRWMAELGTYDEVGLAADSAGILLEGAVAAGEAGVLVRVRLLDPLPDDVQGRGELAGRLAGFFGGLVVRMEPGLRIEGAGVGVAGGLVVLSCADASVLSKGSWEGVQHAEVMAAGGSCFVCFWLSRWHEWGGGGEVREDLFKDVVGAVGKAIEVHVVGVSEAGGYAVVELVGEGAGEAGRRVCGQVSAKDADTPMMQGFVTKHALTASLHQTSMPPTRAGDSVGAGLYVASALSDMCCERRHLSDVLLPALQAVLRPRRVSLHATDLREGGERQTFDQEHLGLHPMLPALERSGVSSFGGDLLQPWVLLLLGHAKGPRHAKDSSGRAALAKSHPWTSTYGRGKASALELEAARVLPSLSREGGACVVSSVLRGGGMERGRAWAEIPASARAAFGGGAGGWGAVREAAANAGALSYEAKVVSYRCPVEVIVARVRELAELLTEDVRAMRGWPDVGGQIRNAPEYRHRLSGVMRSRADDITVHQRRIVRDRKRELMQWWLLLREEEERTRGENGLAPGYNTVHTLQELRRIVKEEPFLDLAGVALADDGDSSGSDEDALQRRVGILDDDGFRCPRLGSAGVAAQGVTLDVGGFSVAFAAAVLPRVAALFPPPPAGTTGLCPPHPSLPERERQYELVRRFASNWQLATIEVGGSGPPAVERMLVHAPGEERLGLGIVMKGEGKEALKLTVRFSSGVRGSKVTVKEHVWKKGVVETNPSADIDGGVFLAPIGSDAVAAMERFARGSPKTHSPGTSTGAVFYVQGGPCSGKSTCLARFVQCRILRQQVVPGIPLPKASDDPVLTSFFFAGGVASPAYRVLADLAEDVESQIGGFPWQSEQAPHVRGRGGGDGGLLQEGRRRLAAALIRAVGGAGGLQGSGVNVLLVVDGLSSAAAEAVGECVARIDAEILAQWRGWGGGQGGLLRGGSENARKWVKLIASCEVCNKTMRTIAGTGEVGKASGVGGGVFEIAGIKAWEANGFFGGGGGGITDKEASANPLYVAGMKWAVERALAASKDAVSLAVKELPDGLVNLFEEGLLRKMEVMHGRKLVEVVCMTLLCCERGVQLADLKAIVREGMIAAGQGRTGGRVGYADMELEDLLDGLRAWLLPSLDGWRGGDDVVCLEHRLLKAAVQRRYDPAATCLWPAETGEDEAERAKRTMEMEKKKKAMEEDLEGYVWVRAKVWASNASGGGDDASAQVEYHVTYESALSVADHHLFHVRRIVAPKPKVVVKEVAKVEEVVDKKTTLSRPGWQAKLPKGLAQGFPFLDQAFEEDPSQRQLLSTAAHPDDASHMRFGVAAGMNPVPEKRYALTQHSAQSQRGKGERDRWESTGGLNPGPAFGTYPPKREAAVDERKMPGGASVRRLAANWGQSGPRPLRPKTKEEREEERKEKERKELQEAAELHARQMETAKARGGAYEKQREEDIFGKR